MTAGTPLDVAKAIAELGLDIEIQTFGDSTRTAPEAAAAIGTELGSIIKSLCFTIDGEPVVVLAAGDHLVDDRKLAAHFSVGRKKVRIADEATTIASTGYAPGGVPPVGHVTELPILIDESLGRFEIVYGAAGSANSIFPIPFTTLVEVTEGKLVDVEKT